MRNLGEIFHSSANASLGTCKISLFAWNGKFLVKFEQGLVEQTLKFEDLELPDGGETAVRARLTPVFIDKVLGGFAALHRLREDFLESAP